MWSKKAEDWIYGLVPKENTPQDIAVTTISANEEYLQIYLRSMRIVNVGKGFSSFYAAVHSYISVAHRSGDDAQFRVLTSPNNLKELDAKRLQNVITASVPLLGPIPYRGGKVGLEIGLFSIKSRDLAAPFLSLITDLSKASGVSFINAAAPFLDPIKNGVEMLTGSSDNTQLELGLIDNLTSIQTGYYLTIRAPKDKYKMEDFAIDTDRRLVYKTSGQPVNEFPYMIFQVFTTKTRDDFFKIPEIQKTYKKLQDKVAGVKNYDQVSDLLDLLRIQLLSSNDLIQADGKKIYASIEKEIHELFPDTNTSGAASANLRSASLKDLHKLDIFAPEAKPATDTGWSSAEEDS